MKSIIIYFSKLLSIIILIIYKLYYNKRFSFKCRGVALIGLSLRGSVSFHLKSGKIAKTKFIIYGKNIKLFFDDDVKIYNCKFVISGDNCIIDFRGARNMVDSKFELLDSNTQLIVSGNTGFKHNRVLVAGNQNSVRIGSDCIFAEGVEIWASDTHSILDINTNCRINNDAPIEIGNRVWLGNRALVMKGVKIGNDVVVAAGSIVTNNVPDNSLVAGVPAKVIKNNIRWDIRRI